MDKMQKDLGETINSELQIFYHMCGVMVQMMIFDVEQQNILFKGIDVPYMENYKAL